ncbi:hypothetical protein B0T11DRAFT_275897 [Plectosphaerella cucumerina]|uniref:Integral membrane protein n=1 Tax=Plectosphaerella cucumerina TaxID=40658 RepID=A0A8K0TR26_9PEZI|nr:hypothetical protein B0T11DRAFT_275897 [Plectosphaerella cucumerina]
MVSKGHPVPLLTSVAVWLSIPLAPLSAEAIGLKIHGRCHKNSIQGCALNLGVSSLEAYVLVGVLGLLALLLVGLLVAVSRRWKTGVFADPWCAAGAAALVRNPDVRSLGAPDFRAVKSAIADKQFTLGWFRNHEGREEYGLVLCDEAGRSLRGARREQEGSDMMVQTAYAEGIRYHGDSGARMVRRPPVTFVSLTFWWRLMFLIYLVALMGLVIYYQLGIKVPEEFRRFVEGQDFGMRFISSALGMVVIMCWDAIYCSVAIIAPYRRMANGSQSASRSVLAKRPTYALTGIYAGIRERDPLLFGVAFMTVLADFLPMVFANVPYDLTQTKDVHVICARVSAGLLFVMAVALTASMFVRWPEMPVDPRSVAGEMWYVAEARWVDRLEGVAVMTDRERKKHIGEMGGRWYYGLTGTGMGERMGVEMHDMYGTMEYQNGFR